MTTTFDEFQEEVASWVDQCFGPESAADVTIRIHRFIEEAIELAQAVECPKKDVLALVEYVYSRPVGDIYQEVGGVTTTLTALCNSLSLPLGWAADTELQRAWEKIDLIREKSKRKPSFGDHAPSAIREAIEIYHDETFDYRVRCMHLTKLRRVLQILASLGFTDREIGEKAKVPTDLVTATREGAYVKASGE